VSVLAILLIYPYDIYVNLAYEEEKLAKKLAKKKIAKKDSHAFSSVQLSRYEQNNYEKNKYNDENTSQEIGYLKLIFGNLFKSKIEQNQNEELPVYEPLLSLIVSYPFVQLTFVFFFACLYSVIELATLRRLGLLFGQHEDFLWKTSLVWKIMNACFFSFWGYYLDKFGIKKILMTVLVSEIINNSMCYFLLQTKMGYMISTGLSAAINSAYLGITPTCYALIFGDEKGILLYSISSILINTFYICRPIINHIVVNDKVYFLMVFMIMTIFSMFSLIILCFFEEKQHTFKDEIIQQRKESFFKRASELSDIDTNGEENSEGNNSLFRGISNSPK
jgi:hypothetical protein